jgi:MFS family permease
MSLPRVLEPRASRPNLTLGVLALAGLAFALLQSLVAPALTTIQHEVGASESGVTWVLTSYLLSAAVATPILGRLGDVHGKRRVLIVALGGLAAGALVAAIASSLSMLIAGRLVQGLRADPAVRADAGASRLRLRLVGHRGGRVPAAGRRHRPGVRGDGEPHRAAVDVDGTGVATGMNTVARTVGGAFGGQLAATFVAGSVAASGLPTVQGGDAAFLMALVALAIAFVSALLIPGRPSRAGALAPATEVA